ncbi:MAG: PorV/PorQ family protein [Candidatus Eisenbacteria sp.]|nr:PorV/PorQ family protein [Candidatus Eisenbacteria bacterium]
MVKRTVVAVAALLVLAAAAPASGSDVFEKVGTVGAQFLKIGMGARATAMGEAFVPVADDASTIYWNPAGIARISGSELTLNYGSWPADISHQFAGYVFSYATIPGVFAFSISALQMAPMPVTTAHRPGGTGKHFDAGDMALGLSYARSLTDRFSFGGTLKWIHSGLADEKAEGFVGDFGTLYDTGFRGVKIGMVVQSLGPGMTFVDQEFPMPVTFKFGVSSNIIDQQWHLLQGAFEFDHPSDGAERVNLGAEYLLKQFEPKLALALRGGYRLNRDEEGLTFGFGVEFPFVPIGFEMKPSRCNVDYCYGDMGRLGGTHRVSLGLAY